MASITLSGTLLDPNSAFAVGDVIRFTHKSTTGNTLSGAVSLLTIDQTGSYSISLEYGLVLVEYKDSKNLQFKNLGVATVNANNPAVSLPELMNAVVPVSSAELIEFQTVLADTIAAKNASVVAKDASVVAKNASVVAKDASIVAKDASVAAAASFKRVTPFDTLALAIAETDTIKIFSGASLLLSGRVTKNDGGGGAWDVYPKDTFTADEDHVNSTALDLQLVLRKPNLLVLDQIGDDVSSITKAITDYKTVKVVGDNALASGATIASYCFVEGDAWNNSKITATVTEDEAAFTVGNGFNIAGINLVSANSLNGIGVSSGNNQVAFHSYSDMAIGGFKYGIWHRQSLWNSYKNLILGGNLCGIRLARADYVSDNSNPTSGSWNSGSGWFNNQITMDNVLADGSGGGEVGVWACGVGMTLNSVTCQDMLTDGTSNQILPDGQVGTGLILDSGTNDSIDGYGNVVNSFYAENVGIAIHLKGQKYTKINAAFVQGKAGITKHALLAERSIAEISMTGQDSFTDGVIKAIDGSTVYVDELIGPVIGTKFSADATSIIYPRGKVDRNKTDYFCNGTGTPGETFTFPEVVPQGGFVTLRFVGLNDGFSVRYGTAKLYNWNNASGSVFVWENSTPPTAVTVAVSNGGAITMEYNSSQVFQGRVQIVQEGGFGISTTGKTLTPV